jgi:[ribosomal protein S18]-alanine N-acetyltransferase
MKIRMAVEADRQPMMLLAIAAEPAVRWSEQWYEHIFREPGRCVLVADRGDQLVGWVVAHNVAADWEIENIVVTEGERRQGIGSALLAAAIAAARQAGAQQILLEVRESNRAARGLYGRYGFRETGRRTRYYSSPEEDAILLAVAL